MDLHARQLYNKDDLLVRMPVEHPKCPFIARETGLEGCELDMAVHLKPTSAPESNDLEPKEPEQEDSNSSKSDHKDLTNLQKPRRKPKQKRKVTLCEHTHEEYYSKGLCKNCYHRKGRVKLASLCPHPQRKLYARGVCKGCYLKLNSNKKDKRASITLEELH